MSSHNRARILSGIALDRDLGSCMAYLCGMVKKVDPRVQQELLNQILSAADGKNVAFERLHSAHIVSPQSLLLDAHRLGMISSERKARFVNSYRTILEHESRLMTIFARNPSHFLIFNPTNPSPVNLSQNLKKAIVVQTQRLKWWENEVRANDRFRKNITTTPRPTQRAKPKNRRPKDGHFKP